MIYNETIIEDNGKVSMSRSKYVFLLEKTLGIGPSNDGRTMADTFAHKLRDISGIKTRGSSNLQFMVRETQLLVEWAEINEQLFMDQSNESEMPFE